MHDVRLHMIYKWKEKCHLWIIGVSRGQKKKRTNVSATIEFRSLGISFSELIIILRYLYLIWR